MGRKVKPLNKLSKKVAGRRTVGIDDDTYKKLRKLSKDKFRSLNGQLAMLVNEASKKEK